MKPRHLVAAMLGAVLLYVGSSGLVMAHFEGAIPAYKPLLWLSLKYPAIAEVLVPYWRAFGFIVTID